MRVLVVGAAPRSLGFHVGEALSVGEHPSEVQYAGLPTEGHGGYTLDLWRSSFADMLFVLEKARPDHLVCTAGINEPQGKTSMVSWYERHLEINTIGPMRLLEAWLTVLDSTESARRHFVAISSNSAHIARRGSAAYCASKAALSMALRVKAREMAGRPVTVYGYEPGLLVGTPMTDRVRERIAGGPMTRIPGQPVGLPTMSLALQIANNVRYGGLELNGCLLRIDGGEQ